MRVLVLGYGRSGKAAAALLKAQGATVVVLDGEAEFPSPQDGHFDVVVVSPGIPLVHPWLVEATRRGIPLRSEMQLGCETLRRQGWRLLAVTGSKGKSSVVKVVAEAIGLAGGRGVACGNYGVPVCEVAWTAREETEKAALANRWAVVEVSSFMMETTSLPSDTFEAAAILNLQEDHLDRHGSVEVYHGLKRRLLGFAKHRYPMRAPEAEPALWRGSYFDNAVLAPNAALAAALMRAAGLAPDIIRRAFSEFRPLAHRMEPVAEIGGVRYVDDSKATSIAALVAGVSMCRGAVRLIAGGLAKGDDPKLALPVLTAQVKKVYIIGQCAEAFYSAWSASVSCEICVTLDRAVASARREAEPGQTVLLSPGTASFDQFTGFGERGEVFARLVKKEG